MKLQVTFRLNAEADLDGIFDYIALDNPERAIAFVRRIRLRCEGLSDYPEVGRPRADLAYGVRTLGFEKRAVIAYVVTARAVEIVRVLYGGRHVEALFGQDG